MNSEDAVAGDGLPELSGSAPGMLPTNRAGKSEDQQVCRYPDATAARPEDPSLGQPVPRFALRSAVPSRG